VSSASEGGFSVSELGVKLDGTIEGLETLVTAVDADKVRSTIDNVESFSADLRDGGEKVDAVVASVEKAAANLESFSGNLTSSLERFDEVIGAVDSESVKATIADIRETASGAREVVADVRGVSKTFNERRDDIDSMVSNAREMVERLNQSSKRVDGVLAKLDGFLGSDGSETVMTDISETLAEFRRVATTLQTTVSGISAGLTRFSNAGLQDVEALIGDARRSIGRFDRVISTIEQDPQEFLFGGSNVRTYNGRPRR